MTVSIETTIRVTYSPDELAALVAKDVLDQHGVVVDPKVIRFSVSTDDDYDPYWDSNRNPSPTVSFHGAVAMITKPG